MKRKTKIGLSIVIFVLILGLFVSTCTLTYVFDLNTYALWWGWFLSIWFLDIIIGLYVFYRKNSSDEMKTFWLFIMIVIPISGAFIALLFNSGKKSEYINPNNDHARLQSIIFQAQKSLKIYTNSFFVSNDTFNALNYARWKNIKIQIIVSIQKTKSRQNFLIYKMQKMLEDKIEFYCTNKQIHHSFIIKDDETIIATNKNFNFRYIYELNYFTNTTNIDPYLTIWNNGIESASPYSLKRDKLNIFKSVKNKVINIFSPFF